MDEMEALEWETPERLAPPVTGDPVQPGTTRQRPLPTLNEIRERALRKWESAGRPSADNLRFWLQAEQELLRGD